MSTLYGGIEAGGTKFVCAVGTGPSDLRIEPSFPTTTAEETIGRAIAFFQKQQEPLTAIGIGSFGPIDPNPASPTFGYITTTPKPGWANTDFAGTIQRALGIPVSLDTDVNVAALGEHHWGAAQGLDSFIYLTVGSGIGGGGMMNGQLMHGLLHPEMGHIRIPHDWNTDPYAGFCPYHGDCLEGLAAAPAMELRWGQPPETLPVDHSAWSLEAGYLAMGLANFIPRYKGGEHTWENVVSACISCNRRKAGKTPEQARMRLLRHPSPPRGNIPFYIPYHCLQTQGEWQKYLPSEN